MSREEFIDYYETRHVPLILRLLPQITEYRRNYVQLQLSATQGKGSDAIDVVTEAWFEDKRAFDEFRIAAATPAIQQLISQDEKNFVDSGSLRMFVVEERVSSL